MYAFFESSPYGGMESLIKYVTSKLKSGWRRDHHESNTAWTTFTRPGEPHVLFITPTVRNFSLKPKKYISIDIKKSIVVIDGLERMVPKYIEEFLRAAVFE